MLDKICFRAKIVFASADIVSLKNYPVIIYGDLFCFLLDTLKKFHLAEEKFKK